MTTSTVHLTVCPNCGTTLEGPFCGQCGQKVAPLNPSFGEFLHDLIHELAHVDSKIVQSVRLLLLRPGFLSREHFDGRRSRYVSPIRLYLVFSLLYFAVAAFSPVSAMRITFKPGPNDDPQYAEMRRAELQATANEVLTHWTPRAMFVLVPAFAGLVALAARRSGRNYPQHLYFALHLHAAWFFAGSVVAAARIANVPPLSSAVSGLASLYGAVYFVLAFRRAYDAPLAGSIWRVAAVGVTYTFVVLVTLVAMVFPVIMRKLSAGPPI
jgi:hypothetical protein